MRTAGEVISSVVFGGAGCFFLVAATDPARGMVERAVLGVCALGTGLAAFRFEIALWVVRRRRGASGMELAKKR